MSVCELHFLDNSLSRLSIHRFVDKLWNVHTFSLSISSPDAFKWDRLYVNTAMSMCSGSGSFSLFVVVAVFLLHFSSAAHYIHYLGNAFLFLVCTFAVCVLDFEAAYPIVYFDYKIISLAQKFLWMENSNLSFWISKCAELCRFFEKSFDKQIKNNRRENQGLWDCIFWFGLQVILFSYSYKWYSFYLQTHFRCHLPCSANLLASSAMCLPLKQQTHTAITEWSDYGLLGL